jgi:hypothetical protein
VLAEAEKKRGKEILEKLLIDGLESGEPIAVTPEYWQKVEADFAQIIAAKQKSDRAS